MADTELLKRAVVSLEKKLRESAASVSALQGELRGAREDAVELPAVRARLAEEQAVRQAAQAEAACSRREAADARAAAEDAQRLRDRASEAAGEAEELAARHAAAAERWRGDAEALHLEAARAKGQAELSEQQVQQLEANNAALRQDNQRHAGKLKEAYEREGELLAEVSQLQAQLRRQQAQRAAAQPGTGASSGVQAQLATAASRAPRAGTSGMEQMHRELFLAAAQQLTAEFIAKVEQADQRAAQLERQLEGLARPAELLQRQVSELREEAQQAQEQCDMERAAAASLLEANLRLHETVLVLVEQAGRPAAAEDEEAPPAQQRGTQRQWQQQEVQRRPGRLGASGPVLQGRQLSATRAQTSSAARPCSAQTQVGRAVQQRERLLPGRGAPQVAGALKSLQAAAPSHPAQPKPHQGQPQPALTPRQAAARQAAVDAALALSAEHRELHTYYKAIAAELQRVAGSLAGAAAPGKQLALLRQHAELQEELRGVAVQLEDRVVQLTALRQAGLL